MLRSYDCIVLGGGPAGSTVAALVAKAGCRTLLVECKMIPRSGLGESLMPETYWTLERLGVLEQMKASNFPKKYSVQFIGPDGRESPAFYFFESDPRECSQTWQVVRAQFDQMLWNSAARAGATCRDRVAAIRLLSDSGRAVGVQLKTQASCEELRARVVVDATQRHADLARSVASCPFDASQHKAAIWGYYENARRSGGLDEGATLVLQTSDRRAWFWFIPLANNTVSVGVIGDHDYLVSSRGPAAGVFEEELVKCPAVLQRLVEARLISELRVAEDFSHSCRRVAGDGWVLVGDAFSPLDPVFSSGVLLALKSGELAADAIVEGLHSGDTSAAQLGKWSGDFLRGADRLRTLVNAFYGGLNPGELVSAHPECKREMLDLLAGKVFHRDSGEISARIDAWLARDSDVRAQRFASLPAPVR